MHIYKICANSFASSFFFLDSVHSYMQTNFVCLQKCAHFLVTLGLFYIVVFSRDCMIFILHNFIWTCTANKLIYECGICIECNAFKRAFIIVHSGNEQLVYWKRLQNVAHFISHEPTTQHFIQFCTVQLEEHKLIYALPFYLLSIWYLFISDNLLRPWPRRHKTFHFEFSLLLGSINHRPHRRRRRSKYILMYAIVGVIQMEWENTWTHYTESFCHCRQLRWTYFHFVCGNKKRKTNDNNLVMKLFLIL